MFCNSHRPNVLVPTCEVTFPSLTYLWHAYLACTVHKFSFAVLHAGRPMSAQVKYGAHIAYRICFCAASNLCGCFIWNVAMPYQYHIIYCHSAGAFWKATPRLKTSWRTKRLQAQSLSKLITTISAVLRHLLNREFVMRRGVKHNIVWRFLCFCSCQTNRTLPLQLH